ncbi:MAG: HNH endonuclease signature motif containing protein [Gammaproteobacteria bacterium]|nr:HNH endonuclease signature motif containing protein [Gammaproteobacteria bacterium]
MARKIPIRPKRRLETIKDVVDAVLEKEVDTTDKKTIQAVWEKGKTVRNRDGGLWRQDDFGNLIKRDEYGNRDSDTGWEIDHIKLVKDGGKDVMSNLRPLHAKTNAARQEG